MRCIFMHVVRDRMIPEAIYLAASIIISGVHGCIQVLQGVLVSSKRRMGFLTWVFDGLWRNTGFYVFQRDRLLSSPQFSRSGPDRLHHPHEPVLLRLRDIFRVTSYTTSRLSALSNILTLTGPLTRRLYLSIRSFRDPQSNTQLYTSFRRHNER